MRIVVALDSFKGSLRATEACGALRRGILRERPAADVILRPMADGGEGTAETLLAARGGTWVSTRATGPRPEIKVDARFVWLPGEEPAALVEMAAASGLDLLDPAQLDPLRTTTYGTGELLAAAIDRGARRVWLAIGGSATVDGGTGAAAALGLRFLDNDGAPVGHGGGALIRIATIVRPDAAARAAWPRVEVLCDVDNPLLGPRGAARVFGPQKGATPEMVETLEAGLAHLADLIETQLGVFVRDAPGGGAAGGLGAGAMAFLDATLVPGVDAVMEAVGLDRSLAGADWVVTGEGRFDEQSLHGKVVSGILARARGAGASVAVVAGQVALAPEQASAAGIRTLLAATPEGMALTEAMAGAEGLLVEAGARFARSLPEAEG